MNVRRISTVVVAIALVVPSLLVAASTPAPVIDEAEITSGPSRLCHPKKPITCRANELPAAHAVEAIESAWLLNALVEPQQLTKPQVEAQEAALCMPPRWLCSTTQLK